VYGIAGHCSRFATTPLMELVMITGLLKLKRRLSLGGWGLGIGDWERRGRVCPSCDLLLSGV
jgi:hypothetical protein